jgi:HEAT repeat protein
MSLISLVAWIRAILVPVLVVTASVLCALLVWILVSHAIRAGWARRNGVLLQRYRPLIDDLLSPDHCDHAIAALAKIPARHRDIVSDELMAILRVGSGSLTVRVRHAAARLGLTRSWRDAVDDRRWWKRAAAVRALGSVGESDAAPAIVRRLDDAHEEVRAAAVESLGQLGDSRAIRPLVAGLSSASQLQRARVVLALRALGPRVVDPLLAHERRDSSETATTADLLGLVGATTSISTLTSWCTDARADVRAAALRALGTLGLSDHAYFYALRALGDESVEVRAMAARAVGKSRRRDAAPYLARTLHDDWTVAAHGARGLRELGAAGRAELERVAHGPGGDLARQMLWELDRRAAAGA